MTGWAAHWWFTITGARDEAGGWYGLWSGFGGALPDVLLLTAFLGWARHNQCHRDRCWRLGRHPVGQTGIRTCRVHHPELGGHRRLTGEKIASLHHRDRP